MMFNKPEFYIFYVCQIHKSIGHNYNEQSSHHLQATIPGDISNISIEFHLFSASRVHDNLINKRSEQTNHNL